MRSYWEENATQRVHTLVDCGYLNDQQSRDNADKVLKHVSRRNMELAGFRRIVIRIPPMKLASVLKAVPEIKEGAAEYCWCTHGFAPLGGRDA